MKRVISDTFGNNYSLQHGSITFGFLPSLQQSISAVEQRDLIISDLISQQSGLDTLMETFNLTIDSFSVTGDSVTLDTSNAKVSPDVISLFCDNFQDAAYLAENNQLIIPLRLLQKVNPIILSKCVEEIDDKVHGRLSFCGIKNAAIDELITQLQDAVLDNTITSLSISFDETITPINCTKLISLLEKNQSMKQCNAATSSTTSLLGIGLFDMHYPDQNQSLIDRLDSIATRNNDLATMVKRAS